MAAEIDPKSYVPQKPRPLAVLAGIGVVLLVCAIAGGLVLAHGASLRSQTRQLEDEQEKGPLVLVTHATMAPSKRVLEVPCSTVGYDQTPVYAKLPGYMKTIYVDKGDRVKTGQLLAILESPETDKQVADAWANYWLQKVTDDRNQRLVRAEVIPQQDADNTHSAMLQSYATWLQLKATQSYEVIRSPFEGIVTARYADPGTLIPEATAATGTTTAQPSPLLLLATFKPLRVYAQVPQSIALFIRDGDNAVVTFTELPKRQFAGSVNRHAKMVSNDTRTMLVEVDLPNDDLALYPGMYGKISFNVEAPEGVPMAPDDALVFEHGKTYVPVVRGGHLHLAEVVLGYDDGMNVEITSGLSSDDLVAINLGQAVQDGEPVRTVPIKPD
jgi:membrane fusion protein, multidrug efflux system